MKSKIKNCPTLTMSSSETGEKPPKRRKAKRVASIYFWEDDNNKVFVDYFDSQVNKTGHMKSFDSLAYVCQQEVFFKVKQMIGSAMVGIKQTYSSAPRDVQRDLERAENKLEKIRQLSLSIRTGRGGSRDKSDPYDIQRKLNEIL